MSYDYGTVPPRRHGPRQTNARPVLESGAPASYAICKICRTGIFDGQPRVWLSQPAGLSHATCAPTTAGAADGAR